METVSNKISIHDSNRATAQTVLAEIMKYRRVPRSNELCNDETCHHCQSVHLPKIIKAIENQKPVSFVLPAFPGKSPNTEKVLGTLPDHAERLSLMFLANLSTKIKQFYKPGIKIIICSDGRVFSDVVGMNEKNVSEYQSELSRIIDEMELEDLSTFNLDNHFEDLSFNQMRDELMKLYGTSTEVLQHKVRKGTQESASLEEKEANRMYCGITRFMYEDSLFQGQTKSKSALQNEARIKAYEVIRRSNAWSELLVERFPDAVRLSIHPQTCGSKKLGIRLVGNESWMTPWHGVAVKSSKGFILMKRSEAEALNAVLKLDITGRPSHYEFLEDQNLAERRA